MIRQLAIVVLATLLTSLRADIVKPSPTNSLDVADIQYAIDNFVVDGRQDILQLAPGTNGWLVGLNCRGKSFTLQGAGYYTGLTNGNTITGVTNHTGVETVIYDGLTNRGSAMLISTYTNTTGFFWVTGIQFARGTNASANNVGLIQVRGVDNRVTLLPRWRISNCYINRLNGRMGMYGAQAGLMDHNYIVNCGTGFWGRNSTTNKGHLSWATDVPFGTVDEGVYMENNWNTNTSIRAMTDGFAGARFVVRYNHVVNGVIENHGTESTQEYRGGRWMTAYNNLLFATLTGERAIFHRSGTGIIASNSVAGTYPGLWRGRNYRTQQQFPPWNLANGINVWDVNYTNLYDSGTYTGPTMATVNVVDSGKSWTVNEWASHSVVNLSTPERGGRILSNTGTTLILDTTTSGGSYTWTTGDLFQIRKVDIVLDGIGRGKGDLLVGGSATVPPTPTTWPNEISEPIHFWDNQGITNLSHAYTVIAGRDTTNTVRSDYIFLPYPHPNIALTEGAGTAPSINTQPASQTITSGQTATLTIGATGTAPLTYQWYLGTSGVTTGLISGATSSTYITPTLTTTSNYWGRVENLIGSADSDTATITIEGPAPGDDGGGGIGGTARLRGVVNLRVLQ